MVHGLGSLTGDSSDLQWEQAMVVLSGRTLASHSAALLGYELDSHSVVEMECASGFRLVVESAVQTVAHWAVQSDVPTVVQMVPVLAAL